MSKNNFIKILSWLIALSAVILMVLYAPFGFLFPNDPIAQLVQVLTIFFSAILILYMLKK